MNPAFCKGILDAKFVNEFFIHFDINKIANIFIIQNRSLLLLIFAAAWQVSGSKHIQVYTYTAHLICIHFSAAM